MLFIELSSSGFANIRIRRFDFANAGFRARQRSNSDYAFTDDRTLCECSDVGDAVQGAASLLFRATPWCGNGHVLVPWDDSRADLSGMPCAARVARLSPIGWNTRLFLVERLTDTVNMSAQSVVIELLKNGKVNRVRQEQVIQNFGNVA
jgi:hypothetical protein